MQERVPWYVSWFDSPYYHVLYDYRDQGEAHRFMLALSSHLGAAPNSHFVDLGCGRGRHAKALRDLGYRITGLDLSPSNIELARQNADELLRFEVHDMRSMYQPDHFDYALNLFTSFGFFEEEQDMLRTLRAIYHNLKPGGILVLDYLNAETVARALNNPVQSLVVKEGIQFRIEKRIRAGFVIKTIAFEADGHKYEYTERVALLNFDQFSKMLVQTGFKIQTLFGDYELNPYDSLHSERLIITALK